MSSLFCCDSIQPFKPQRLTHELKFSTFMSWAKYPQANAEQTVEGNATNLTVMNPEFVIQLVRQVNYGPLESTRYFAKTSEGSEPFVEVTEKDLIEANFQKLNAFKNYRCAGHDKFFEVNVYQKDPINKHHWRANLARPATSIDL